MRIYILLALCGLIQSSTASCPVCDDVVELNYSNVGEGWFMRNIGPLNNDFLKALKGSGDHFLSADFFQFIVSLSSPVDVLKMEAEVLNTRSIEHITRDASNNYLSIQVQFTVVGDIGIWQLGNQPFIVGDSHVTSISVRRFPITGLPQGLRNMAFFVCNTGPCIEESLIATNTSLALPSGFNIEVQGASLNGSDVGFSIDPEAVLKGSESKINLRNDPMLANSIKMTFDALVNVRTINIRTRYAKGLIVNVFRTLTINELIYTRRVTIDVLDQWIETVITAPIGVIKDIRRIDIEMIYNLDAANPSVNVKDLCFYTCA